MKKTFISLLALLLFVQFVAAQAYEGTIEYKKKKRAAFIIEYPFPPEAVENAIDQKMEKLGYRGKEEKGLFNGDKGFKSFSHAYITDVSDEAIDYIIKVERKSKKQDDKSVVYLITMKGDDDHSKIFDELSIGKAKSFLNNFQPNIESADLDIKIKSKEGDVTKAEKKLKKLRDDQAEMEEKIKKLQDSLTQNAKEQEEAAKNLDDQKQTLETLRANKKS